MSFSILCNHYITGLPKSQALFSLFYHFFAKLLILKGFAKLLIIKGILSSHLCLILSVFLTEYWNRIGLVESTYPEHSRTRINLVGRVKGIAFVRIKGRVLDGFPAIWSVFNQNGFGLLHINRFDVPSIKETLPGCLSGSLLGIRFPFFSLERLIGIDYQLLFTHFFRSIIHAY